MAKAPEKLANIWPVNVMSDTGAWSTPSASVIFRHVDLWKTLNRIIQDWKLEANRFQAQLDTITDENKKMSFMLYALEDDQLGARFIQCLLSYITFLFMLENGYKLVYSQLNSLNRELQLYLPHSSLANRTEFIERLWLIRNRSIAHWADTAQPGPDNSAGRDWGFFWNTGGENGWSIEHLKFGGTSVGGAQPRDTKPIPEMHELCTAYLEEMDQVCASYLLDIKSRMPMVVNNRQYFNPDEYKPRLNRR